MVRTAEAAHSSARWQHRRPTGSRLEGGGELCVAGDFNQEWEADGPRDPPRSKAFERILDECGLSCVTGGDLDPLQARGWGANIYHVVLSQGLRATGPPMVWPK